MTQGYAGYWDAQHLSWQTDMRPLVAPVQNCAEQLCPYNFFTIRSRCMEQRGPTFLLVNPHEPGHPCASVRRARRVHTSLRAADAVLVR
jgi:hypothetical protein